MKRLLPYVGPLLAFAALVVFESDYLYRAQELNLFLDTSLFLRQCMTTAGGLLTWTGAYLTQYFHYPALGAALLCLLWALLMWLLKLTFRLPRSWMLTTLVPVACLLLTMTDLGYWLYYLKLRGHLFDATLGTLVAVGLAFLYLHVPPKYGLRSLYIVFAACIGYPLFGFYALWAVVLMALLPGRAVDKLLALLMVAAVPLACYHLLYHETHIVNIYWAALPVFCHTGQRYFAYNLPYIVLVASTLVMALCYRKERKEQQPPRYWRWGQTALLAAAAVCVVVFCYKDDNFHRELSMMRHLEQEEWELAVSTSANVKGEPTRAICIMRNIALARLGRQGDEMFRHPNGAKRPDAPFPVRMVDVMGRLIYLKYGVLNYCYRWCMEDGVEYGWSVEKLKLMAVCSLLNGEFVAAHKYLSLLKKCSFQGEWAKKYTAYARSPQLMTKDPELRAIMRLQRPDNFLTSDMSQLEKFLLEHFATARSAEPALQEQTLIAAMQTKDARLFWETFYQYSRTHQGGQRLPRHYQEAVCLFAHLQHADDSQMRLDPQVAKDYEDFTRTMDGYRQHGWSIDQIRPKMYDRFHTTYFYDFYFNRYNYIEP